MNKNITLRMNEGLLKEARHRAVDKGLSVSAFITQEVERLLRSGENESPPSNRALALMKKGFHLGGQKFRREELYDRL